MTNSGQSTTFNYFVASGAVLTDTTKTTVDLAPLQLGLFSTKNYKALAQPTSAKVVPEIIIAMGSPNEERISWTNAAESFKTVPIRADRLIAWRKSTPKKPRNHKVAIGWDGVSDCKTLTAKCDETYTLHVQVEGSPATRFFGAKPLSETFVYVAPCCGSDCTGDCDADVEAMADFYVKEINKSVKLSQLIKAEKLVSYTEAPTTETVDYESYTLTVADEGEINDLAAVQVAYNDTSITRISRDGIFSTYLLIQLESASAPAAYSNQAITTISNCTDCPSGYELVEKTYEYKVQRQDAGTDANLTTVQGGGGYSDSAAYRLSYVNGESTYVVHNTTGTTPSPVATGDIVTYIGFKDAHCSLETPTTTAWVESDDYYKTVRELCIVLGDDVCDDVSGTAQLDAISAFYASTPGIVTDSVAQAENGTCANSYTIQQESTNLMKTGCTTDIPEYSPVPPYNGHVWNVCCDPESTAGTVDKIGIVLTGAYVDTQFSRCAFEYDDFVELDLPRITVVQGEFVELENKCATRWAVTELQKPQYPTGIGTNVLKEYINIMNTKGQQYSDDPRWRDIYGFNYDFIKNNKYYKHYYLEFEALDKWFTATGFGGNDFKQTVVFAFEEGVDTSAFEALLQSWIGSVRPDLIDADPQDNLYR